MVGVGQNLEFAHGFRTEQSAPRASREGAAHVENVGAVQEIRIVGCAHAGDADFLAVALEGLCLLGVSRVGHRRAQRHELREVPTLEWHLPDSAVLCQIAHRGPRGLHQRSFTGDRDSVRYHSDLKHQIHDSFPPYRQGDARPHLCLEASQLCCYFVTPQRQLGCPVAACLVGTNGSSESRVHITQSQRCAGNRGTRGIADGSQDHSRGALGQRELT